MRKVIAALRIIMFGVIIAYVAGSIYTFIDYKRNPIKYEVNSAPWYTGVELWGVICLLIVLMCIAWISILKNRKSGGR